MYADDTTLFCNFENKHNKNTINNEINNIYKWLCSNKLPLNVSKTKYLCFHTSNKTKLKMGINNKQDAREAMRVVISVLTKRICMHKTNFLRIYSNIVLKDILICKLQLS